MVQLPMHRVEARLFDVEPQRLEPYEEPVGALVNWASWEEVGAAICNPSAVRKLELEDGRMMRSFGITTPMPFKKDFLLETLKKNRETHEEVYQESLKGYLEKAMQKIGEVKSGLAEDHARLAEGEHIELRSIHFGLELPSSHIEVYDTVISMLENTMQDTIELSPDAYRELVLDEWDWQRGFLVKNSAYSGTARRLSVSKGYSK